MRDEGTRQATSPSVLCVLLQTGSSATPGQGSPWRFLRVQIADAPRARRRSLYWGCSWFPPSWGPTLPTTPTTRLLPLKESCTLGVAKPWSLGWAARQPRVSRVAQRRTPTTGMVGMHLGAKIEGSLGELSLPRRAHEGGMSVHCTHHPLGVTSPTSGSPLPAGTQHPPGRTGSQP